MALVTEKLSKFDPNLIKNIYALEEQSFGKEAAANQWLLPVLIRYGKVFIIRETKGKLIGACLAIRSWDERSAAFIHSFHIREDYRSRGIGSSFLSEIIDMIREDGIDIVKLTVDPENLPAIKVYKKHGFKAKGLEKDEYGAGIDRLVMELAL